MLEDRDYMRRPDYRDSRVSFTVVLLIVNAVVFLIQTLASHSSRGSEMEGTYFALSLEGLKHGFIWQLLTFQFMHAGLMHLLFNSLAIYFFGRVVETAIGGAKFLTLYFSSGVIGGLLQMLLAFFIPASFGGLLVGASAGGFGLVAAFAVMKWYEPFTLFLYFIPVTMRGRTLFWVSIAIAVFGMIALNDGVAHAAHLGGIFTGFFFARHLVSRDWSLPQISFGLRRKSKSHENGSKKSDGDLSAEELLQREVDPILEKISAHGIQSLTAREREILQKARSKMDKR